MINTSCISISFNQWHKTIRKQKHFYNKTFKPYLDILGRFFIIKLFVWFFKSKCLELILFIRLETLQLRLTEKKVKKQNNKETK